MKATVIHLCIYAILLFSLVSFQVIVYAETTSSLSRNPVFVHVIPEDQIVVDSDSLFDVFFVSNDQLQQLMSHKGPDTGILKADPGLILGLISPTALYIRSDLDSRFLPEDLNDSITMDDISLHLIDIVFGKDNPKISVFKSDRDYKFFFTDEYLIDDISTVLDFAKIFNDISNIVTIEDEECERSFLPGSYLVIPYHYYNITIVSPLRFSEYLDDKEPTEGVIRSLRGKTIGIVTRDRLILTDDLSRAERRYYLLRGILWGMGFHGESTQYMDSFFSKGKMNQNFSDIDLQVLALLYGGRLQDDMDLEGVKKALNLIDTRKEQVIR